MVNLDADTARRWLAALEARFEAEHDRLNALDALAGDGDHGTTMLRGLRAATAARDTGDDARAVLNAAGTAFRRTAGGASGPLFSSVFLEIARAAENASIDAAAFTAGLEHAAAAVARLGKAEPGDRTMLDALLPAAAAARAEPDLAAAARAAATAAERAADATAAMTARKGRARFVNDGRVTSADAGATSVALILRELQKVTSP